MRNRGSVGKFLDIILIHYTTYTSTNLSFENGGSFQCNFAILIFRGVVEGAPLSVGYIDLFLVKYPITTGVK